MIKKSIAIIVAHPDDETLWAGGGFPWSLDFFTCSFRTA